jgi:hypothetical protein
MGLGIAPAKPLWPPASFPIGTGFGPFRRDIVVFQIGPTELGAPTSGAVLNWEVPNDLTHKTLRHKQYVPA